MSSTRDTTFHLAIAARELAAAEHFYCALLGCPAVRRYPDRLTIDFFGEQLVCHLAADEPRREPTLYPRHFGVTFRNRSDFDCLLRLIEIRGVPLFSKPCQRFAGGVEEHWTVVLRDPSDNLLEFKHYIDPRMTY